jgi:hypothetical protein
MLPVENGEPLTATNAAADAMAADARQAQVTAPTTTNHRNLRPTPELVPPDRLARLSTATGATHHPTTRPNSVRVRTTADSQENIGDPAAIDSA